MKTKKIVIYTASFLVLALLAVFVVAYIDHKNYDDNYGPPVGKVGRTYTKYDYEAVVVSADENTIICKAKNDYINENYSGKYESVKKGTEMVLYAPENVNFNVGKLACGDEIVFTTTGPYDVDKKLRLVMDYNSISSSGIVIYDEQQN